MVKIPKKISIHPPPHDIEMTIKGYLKKYRHLVRDTCFKSRLNAYKTKNTITKRVSKSKLSNSKTKSYSSFSPSSIKHEAKILYSSRGPIRRRPAIKRKRSAMSSRRVRQNFHHNRKGRPSRNLRRVNLRPALRRRRRRRLRTKTAPISRIYSPRPISKAKSSSTPIQRRTRTTNQYNSIFARQYQQKKQEILTLFKNCDDKEIKYSAALGNSEKSGVVFKLLSNQKKQLKIDEKGGVGIVYDPKPEEVTKWVYEYWNNFQLKPKFYSNNTTTTTSIQTEICKEAYESDRLQDYEKNFVTNKLICDNKNGIDSISKLQVFCSSYTQPRRVYIGYEQDAALILKKEKFAHISLYGKMKKTKNTKVKHGFGGVTTKNFKPIELLLPEGLSGKCSDLYLQYYKN